MGAAQGIRAGRAFVELFADDSKLVRGLRAAQRKLRKFGASVRAIGARVLAGGAAFAAPLAGAVKVFASAGDQLNKMAIRTGISAESLSQLAFAAEQSGASLEAVETGLRNMQRSILDAERGLSTATDALARLGLTVDDLKGLSPEEQFKLLADRLARVEDPTMRAALAMKLFGRSGTQLLPLLSQGAAGIEALQQEADRLGLTISTEQAQAAADFADAWNRIKRQLKAAVVQIGGALAPTLTRVLEIMKNYGKVVIDWLAEHKRLILIIGGVVTAVLAGGAALFGLGVAIGAVGTVFGAVASALTLIGSLLGALLSPIGLVIAGIVGLATYLLTSTEAGAEALAWFGQQFQVLKKTALAAFQGIGDAIAAGDIGLAAKILWLTLKMEWQKGINWLQAKWLAFKGFFVGVFQSAVFAIARFMTDAWAGLQIAWVETTAFLADAWTVFIGVLQKTWHRFAGFFKKVWARIKGLFGDTDAEAEIEKINADIAARDKQIEDRQNRTIFEREQERLRRRREIERNRIGAQSTLDDMQRREQAEREAKHRAALKASEDKLAEARREWEAALKEAAEKRAAAEKAGDDKGPDRLKKFRQKLDEIGKQGGALDQAEKRTVGVQGAFNAAALRGLGAGGPADRTAKAVEAMDKKLGVLVREAQHGGLVFA